MIKNIIKRIALPNRRAGRGMLLGSDGFTLLEMLLVVAIIAVLLAVSIPLVRGSLERTRVRVDMANERIAEGLAKVNMLLDRNIFGEEETAVE